MPVLDDGSAVLDEGVTTSMSESASRLPSETSEPDEPTATGVTEAINSTVGYLAHAFGTTAGLRGVAVEAAWCAAHLAGYSLGLLREQLDEDGNGSAHFRTESLSPAQRSVIVSDMDATGTPVLLVHGLMDNRSVFTVCRGALRNRGFGLVHAVNYSAFTQDIRTAAYELRRHVNRLRERTGAEQVHIVGHSLGGLIARYYVQRLGGDDSVHTVATLGTPHGGTMSAYLAPTPLLRQITPGSELLAELDRPAPDCHARFLVVWSELDQLVVPRRNGRLVHPDLDVRSLRLTDVGHMSLALDSRAINWVADSLPTLDEPT